MVKNSLKRQAVLNCLAGRYDHPTAETVFESVRKEYPNISLGTVYRNLSLLAELGQIQKITTGVGPDRFDYNADPHCHFTCRKCGCVIDLDLPIQDELNKRAAKSFKGTIERSNVQFFGLCQNCTE